MPEENAQTGTADDSGVDYLNKEPGFAHLSTEILKRRRGLSGATSASGRHTETIEGKTSGRENGFDMITSALPEK